MTMKRTLLLCVLGVVVAPSAASAATATASVPFAGTVVGCSGNTIQLQGQLLATFSFTVNGAGGFSIATHANPQGIKGVDSQSGATYNGTGVTNDRTIVTPSGGVSFSFVSRFHIQATKGADSFDVNETVHVTQLPDGTVTAFVDQFSASC